MILGRVGIWFLAPLAVVAPREFRVSTVECFDFFEQQLVLSGLLSQVVRHALHLVGLVTREAPRDHSKGCE